MAHDHKFGALVGWVHNNPGWCVRWTEMVRNGWGLDLFWMTLCVANHALLSDFLLWYVKLIVDDVYFENYSFDRDDVFWMNKKWVFEKYLYMMG